MIQIETFLKQDVIRYITNILIQENFLILLYNSSTAKKHLFNLLCTPSLPNTCNVVHNGKVGKRLDNESVIKPDTKDKVVSLVVGRPPFVSVNLYNVYVYIKKKFSIQFLAYIFS